MSMRKFTLSLSAVMIVGISLLSGCAVNSETASPTGTVAAAENSELAALVPSSLASKGVIAIGISPGSPPDEYKDSNGAIVGFDVDLFDAVAATLGLKTKYVESSFDNIIPGVAGGTYDIGVSSFTDTTEREATIDFVTYFNAGTQWASPTGKAVDPQNACGLKVAVLSGTLQDSSDLVAKSAACVAAGKPPIDKQAYDTQDQSVTAVRLGKADAVLADSPAIAYAVKKSDGELVLAGEIEDGAPFGYVLPKGSTLSPVFQQAVQALIDDGTYGEILAKWGLNDGALVTSDINGAKG
jgi:polar amino acid transport system substrate-binding protein